MRLFWWNTLSRNKIWYKLYSDIWTKLTVQAPDRTWDEDLLPFKKTSFFPLYVEYVDEIFNPHPHIPHMRIIRIIRIFRIRMASPSKYSQNWRKTWFRPNFRPKNTNFSGQKFWTSDFGGVCDPKFWNFIIFDTIPTKYGYRRSKLAIGSYASVQNIRFNIIIHFLIHRTPKNTKKWIFSYFPQ